MENYEYLHFLPILFLYHLRYHMEFCLVRMDLKKQKNGILFFDIN